MSKIWILNASPIIVIGKAGLLETVSPITRNWLIPEGVFNEISQKGEATQYVKRLSANAEVEILAVPEIDPIVGGWNLGRGESEGLNISRSERRRRGIG